MNTLNQTMQARFAIAFVATSLITGPAFANEDKLSFEGFKMIKVAPGLAEANSLVQTILPFMDGHPEAEEGNGALELKVRKLDDQFVINIIMSGYADDSVRGEHYRGVVIYTQKNTWKLITMGRKYLCYRSKSASGICS